MEKDPLIINASFVTYMKNKDHQAAYSKLWHLFGRMEKESREIAKEMEQEVECYQSGVYAFRGSKKASNSGRCVVCDIWVSAQNKPHIIGELDFGAEYCGDFYCHEHLPKYSPLYAKLSPHVSTEEFTKSDQNVDN